MVLVVAVAAVFIASAVLVTTEAEAKRKKGILVEEALIRAPIATSDNNVYITWWERNDTSDTPVARVSNDNGATFGPMLMLATNGTIGGSGG